MNCNCGTAKLLEVKKPGPNQGRQFYACAKPQGEQCDFFCWEGETPRGTQKRAGTPKTENGAQSQALTSLILSVNKLLEGQLEIKQLLASIGARKEVVPSPSDTKLPF